MIDAALQDRVAAAWVVGGLSIVVVLTWPGLSLLELLAAGGTPTMVEAIRLALPLSALCAGGYLGSRWEEEGRRRSIREHIAAITLFAGATLPPVAVAAGVSALGPATVPALALLAAVLAAASRGIAIIARAIVRAPVLRSILVWGLLAAVLAVSALHAPTANPIAMTAALSDPGSSMGGYELVERWAPVAGWAAAAAVALTVAARLERGARENRDG
ncbi:MAG: hypothetical protein MI724_07380 [Spirochaetales bacterium]|nr:hypothetical protein [Spirochaetales bacterium]